MSKNFFKNKTYLLAAETFWIIAEKPHNYNIPPLTNFLF